MRFELPLAVEYSHCDIYRFVACIPTYSTCLSEIVPQNNSYAKEISTFVRSTTARNTLLIISDALSHE